MEPDPKFLRRDSNDSLTPFYDPDKSREPFFCIPDQELEILTHIVFDKLFIQKFVEILNRHFRKIYKRALDATTFFKSSHCQ
mmetsp:Transcript_13579/g.21205  ORF Transcript_13579/g.21205 Transcript_13579/m.21205 type:complete len:82 (+) Transcript_13579:974-1219(+)